MALVRGAKKRSAILLSLGLSDCATCKLGANRSGLDHHHRSPQRTQFHTQRIVEGLERIFGRVVRAEHWCRNAPADTADHVGGDSLQFADAFIDALTSGSYLVGAPSATRIRFHHLLAACAKHPPIREQYVGLLAMVSGVIQQALAQTNVLDAAARAETSVVLVMGLLANVDLGAWC